MERIKVTTTKRLVGVCSLAKLLGVTYNHLYQVLNGAHPSVALILKINKVCPTLFKTPYCTIDYKTIIKENKKDYRWDEGKQRYFKLHK